MSTPSPLREVIVTGKKKLFPGMVESGNIDLRNRPRVQNPDGSVSTLLSMSIGERNNQGMPVETLIPRVVGGRVLLPQEAVMHYKKTGEHLGKFISAEHATAYAQAIHQGMGSEDQGMSQSLRTPRR